ncbi:MAG: DUF58 domain-containing protein [Betaproteobacteria bacterium]|jgi:uncharacterized protein (DUF58 family)|nr:DUF58 domain-containing protein [Betaproteobacteria bacterium]
MRFVYFGLRFFSAIDHRLRQRLTALGWIVFVGAAIAALAGIDTSQTATYQAFTLFAALLGLAIAGSAFFRARASIERELPRYLTAGEPCPYRVTVTNRGRGALAGASLEEHYRDPRPGYAEWRSTREPGEERRNWFDREMGYFRWRWAIERRIPQAQPAVALQTLAPGASATVRLMLEPRRRGRIDLAGLTLSRPDPLGMVRSLRRFALPARVIALPRRYRLPELILPGARKYQLGGVSLATSVGDSEEFISLRDYRPGDPLHRLHWKSYARTGKPIVKEYQDEFFERHALVLDTGRAAGEDPVFEDAVALAASFVYTIDTQECLLDLLFVAGEVHQYTAGRGQLPADRMLEILAGVAPGPRGSFGALAHAVLAQRGRLSSCILVFVDWDDARAALMRALAASGMELRALLVCAEDAVPPDLPPGLVVLHPGRIEEGLSRLR